jgi:hypothetical protein
VDATSSGSRSSPAAGDRGPGSPAWRSTASIPRSSSRASRDTVLIAARAARACSGRESARSRPTPAWMLISEIVWPMTSCSSLAIRRRSSLDRRLASSWRAARAWTVRSLRIRTASAARTSTANQAASSALGEPARPPHASGSQIDAAYARASAAQPARRWPLVAAPKKATIRLRYAGHGDDGATAARASATAPRPDGGAGPATPPARRPRAPTAQRLADPADAVSSAMRSGSAGTAADRRRGCRPAAGRQLRQEASGRCASGRACARRARGAARHRSLRPRYRPGNRGRIGLRLTSRPRSAA